MPSRQNQRGLHGTEGSKEEGAEIGIDISSHGSKRVNEFLDKEIDYVVTVCDHARQTCPFFPGGKETIHKGFDDSAAFNPPSLEIPHCQGPWFIFP